MSAPVLRVATRGSALALAQSGAVAARLATLTGASVELVRVSTTGDTDRRALTVIGGSGVFVGAVRAAVLDGRADIAVHSFKDLPTAPAEGLVVGAVPPREDPRDALVARDGLTLDELPDGARIGTGSPRRAVQLLAHARALGRTWRVEPVRGNVDTRLAAVGAGFDAVVVAAAGLARLGRAGEATQVLRPAVMLPAPAQGALAVEAAALAPAWLVDGLAGLDDAAAHAAAVAERAVLAELGAGCSAPVGALALCVDGSAEAGAAGVELTALVATGDGARVWRAAASGQRAAAVEVGRDAARQLLAGGAGELPGIDRPGGTADRHGPGSSDDSGAQHMSGVGGRLR